jgi:DNA-binding cell septation regulator SpoVG
MIYIIASDFIAASGERVSVTQAIKEGTGKAYGSLTFRNNKITQSVFTAECDAGTFIAASSKLLKDSTPQTFQTQEVSK